MNRGWFHAAALASVVTASLAGAQTARPALEPPCAWARETPESLNRFGLSYRFGMNISARFKNVGITPPTAPGAAIGGVPHTYDDGYVLVDSSGDAGGETWFWDYSNASQVYGDNIVMSASNPGDIAKNVDDGPQQGLELTFNRELGRAGRFPWGLEAAFGFTDLTFRNSSTVVGGPLTVDSYAVSREASPPPLPPHGTFAGPGPLIYDTPTRLPVTLTSRLDGSMFGFRLGPYFEIPIAQRLSFTLSGGLALAVVDMDFSYQQTYGSPSGGTVSQSHAGSHLDLMPGGFLAGNLTYGLTKALSVFAGAQYQNTGTYSQKLVDKQAELDLRQCVFVTAGLGFSF